ncbi:hypothetical protein TWF694_008865 [Orbilia ellipsospora]|uniref:cGMP-dependent protein kinase interacting domain-containing protein n=1 Tax=Orbilia ellipsospora TaxID=2528407 RepID=A0AAV9XJN3_9PEZI
MTTTTVPSSSEDKTAPPSSQPSSTGLPTPSSSTGVPPSPRLRQISASSNASNARRPSSSLSEARDPNSSRRHSEQRMLPPPAPLTQPPFAQPPSPGGSIRSVSSISGSEAGANGPGPARLPRQLSPAEIHAELEKEQEAAVNRLTRQLSILRAQQAVSPTSHPISDDLSNTYPATYLSPRSRRTSSNASTALTNAATIGSTMAGSSLSRQSSIQSLSAARGDPAAIAATPAGSRAAPIPMSRQSSVRSISGSRASGRNSPALGESDSPYPYFSSQYYYTSPHHPPGSSWKESAGMVHMHNHHHSRERERGEYAGSETGGSERGLGVSYSSSTSGHPRYEEVLTARNELENVKKENEKLKEKIRELERALSGVSVGSASATASGSGKETKPETEVKSGEP